MKYGNWALAAALALLASAPVLSAPSGPASTAAAAGGGVPTLAIIEIANAGMDPRVDYLSSMVQGILAFDLGSTGDIALVDRRNLDAVLKEKELSLSAIGQDADSAAAAGRLVGADWLLSGEYVFMGADVLITLSLTDTATAKRVVFRDRGSSENLVHGLAEQVALRLTGKQATFAESGRSRSLVSLRDETPGSVALFSPIIKAEVYLDEQFIGYTTGDNTVPLILDKLSPGQHTVRVHLDSSFGVVKLPEVSFHDWQVTVAVEPGKRATLRDQTRQLNDYLYRLIELGFRLGSRVRLRLRAGGPAGQARFGEGARLPGPAGRGHGGEDRRHAAAPGKQPRPRLLLERRPEGRNALDLGLQHLAPGRGRWRKRSPGRGRHRQARRDPRALWEHLVPRLVGRQD